MGGDGGGIKWRNNVDSGRPISFTGHKYLPASAVDNTAPTVGASSVNFRCSGRHQRLDLCVCHASHDREITIEVSVKTLSRPP